MNQTVVHMHRAYELALKGFGQVSPNPMVGAVLVKSGKVIAEGWHAFCGGSHAEAMAMTGAGSKAKGADLYVSLEPCSHYGRTPPCTDAIIKAGIKRVFVGVLDPNPKMNGNSIKVLRKAGIAVEYGFMHEELTCLNEGFNKYITTGMPFVIAKIAQTIDGKIATLSGESKWITSEETRTYGRQLRFGFDAIGVGINTVLADDPQLNTVPKKMIKKIIFDTHLRTPAKARLFEGTKSDDIIIFTASSTRKKLKAQIIQAPLKRGQIDLKWAFGYLAKQEIVHVLLEGGAHLIGSALKEKIVDKMMIYVAPVIMGEGLSSVVGVKQRSLKDLIHLKNTTVNRVGEDILIEGYL